MGSTVTFDRLTEQSWIDRTTIGQMIGFLPGNIFYVDSATGASTYDGLTRGAALATVEQAVDKCTASKGDVICVMPGHAETLSTTTQGIALDVSGITIWGFGNGRNCPALTCGAAAAINGVALSAANCRIHNIRFIGSDTQTTSYVMAITGADNRIDNCVFEHGAGPLCAVGLSGANRTIIEDCTWIGTAAGPDMAIKVYGSSTHLQVRRCLFNYGTVNVDSAAIGVLASSNCANSVFEDLVILGANSTGIRILGSGAATVADSLIARVYGTSSTGITFGAALPFDQGGAAVANCFWTDATAAEPGWIGAALRVGTAIVTATTTGRGFINVGPS